jgi:type I restriction enzyme S subunit
MKTSVHDLLEKHFETAFAAPDGIAKLRELILTLAMRGKLVEQDPNDPPASELLKEIELEKQRLIQEGKIKKPKPLPSIKPEEVPYELPQGWEWVRFGNIVQVLNGRAFKKNELLDAGTPVLRVGNLFTSNQWYFSDLELEDDKYIDDGDLIYAWSASFGPFIWSGERVIYHYHIWKLKFFIEGRPYKEFLYHFLMEKTDEIKRSGNGIAMIHMTKERMEKLLVPVPPLSEQHRIVARIDQLMARCDALEKLRKAREEKRLAVHTAAIKQLLEAKDGTAWDFIQQHFGELYTVKENVAELRKAILQLAVMGRLVPQDPNDPPASELLKEIEAEKQRLIKEGKIKKPKPLPPIKPEEVPYELPQGWEWVRLGELVSKLGSGSTPRGGKSAYVNEGIPFLRSQNVWNDGLRLDDVAYIPEETHKKMEATKVAAKDILLNITGASLGRTSLVPDDFEEANVSQHVTIIRCIQPDQRRFIHFLLQSPYCQRMIWTRQVGMAREGLSKKVLELFEVPLPPLPEQHRIVKRIDQLMALCDTLEQQIDAATGKQTELLNAVMVQV